MKHINKQIATIVKDGNNPMDEYISEILTGSESTAIDALSFIKESDKFSYSEETIKHLNNFNFSNHKHVTFSDKLDKPIDSRQIDLPLILSYLKVRYLLTTTELFIIETSLNKENQDLIPFQILMKTRDNLVTGITRDSRTYELLIAALKDEQLDTIDNHLLDIINNHVKGSIFDRLKYRLNKIMGGK